MSKIVQRLNVKLLAALEQIDEEAKQFEGYSHLSHSVQFDLFPSSLLVLCHFSNEQQFQAALASDVETKLQKHLHKLLLKKGIVLKDPKMNLKLKGSLEV
ncbi:hypothetical protein [Thalassomonas sp. M1454]|uniref:hypothetical protein n=1 Tax=Thalassomonas sp. M1454 TaxID=2594477 RepID=UPI00117DAA9F|nr:hypothetical protein [Thalassomonas sp. M1454]TRX54503.1 hypothetical protein FNN08_12295 [Thalassomonas sp. M1454]